MRRKIIESISQRLNTEISGQNPLKYLLNINPEDYIDTIISIMYLYTRPKKGLNKQSIYMVEIISAIGHGIRNKLKIKRDSALAAKTGGFILYTFEELQMIQVMLGQGSKGHNSYVVQVLDDAAIQSLWETLASNTIEKLPSTEPYKAWTSTKHEKGMQLVKTGNKDVLEKITPTTHPILFDCVNKAQETGWKINQELYDIHLWAIRNKTDAFNDIWELQNPEAKTTKLREVKAIGEIAKRFLNKVFYHMYYYDFRGRKYPATAYLHEQGSDLAKGLLLRSDKKKIGKEGFFWLCVSIASNWAGDAGRDDNAKTDKIPLKDRYHWTLDNEEIILSYAKSPKVNQGWMKADKPWQFLAACFEFKKLRAWQKLPSAYKEHDELYGYESHLECYIDGSNNGSQHLSALTRDEVTAPHVNLIPLDLPGDLYKYVADHVWERLTKEVSKLSKSELTSCETLIDNLTELKKSINDAEPKSDKRKKLIEDIRAFKDSNSNILHKSSAVYWLRIKDNKQRRKIVKR